MTDKVEMRSDATVTLIDSMGTEESIVRAARVSTQGADSRDSGANTGLLRYLYREKHGVPFESCVLQFYMEFPIFTSRQVVKHRLCLSGDTKIRRTFRDGTSYGNVNNTIAKLWELRHVGADRTHRSGKKFKALLPNREDVWVQSYDEHSLEPIVGKVLDVVKNGVKTTVMVATSAGKTIRSTRDHRFFTPDGWKHLYDLKVGDYVYRESKVAVAESRNIPPRLREGIGLWTSGMRDTLIPYDGTNCGICGTQHEYVDLELDHVVPVASNLQLALNPENLQPVCKPCHREKTSTEQLINKRLGTKLGLRPDKIVSIGDPIQEETYDLVLEGPWHNFIAEGLVVHNSSINEESGRYKELEGVFYEVPDDRPLVQVGKTGAYEFEEGGPDLRAAVQWVQRSAAQAAWDNYNTLLDMGVAKEVARMHLPLTIYSSMYFTANLRSVLNFLSLRKDWGENASHASKAQYEIALVADKMAEIVKEKYPTVWESFVESGYQAV